MAEIDNDNRKFYRQLQIHQESMFEFADELYEKYQPSYL
jgi:hypothetical protein